MKHAARIALATTTLGIAGLVGIGSVTSAAGAQELDLCALLGDPYCPPGAAVLGRVVERTGSAGGAGGLARTGSDTAPLVGIGAGLIAAGGSAAYSARRRAATPKAASQLV